MSKMLWKSCLLLALVASLMVLCCSCFGEEPNETDGSASVSTLEQIATEPNTQATTTTNNNNSSVTTKPNTTEETTEPRTPVTADINDVSSGWTDGWH